MVVQSIFLNRDLIIPQRFSIGFKSGEFPGHSNTWTLFSRKTLELFFEEWHGAKSCWKIPLPSENTLFKSGSVLCLRTSIYRSVLIIPSTGTRDPTPFLEKLPQNISCGCLTYWLMCLADNLSPALVRTNWLGLPFTKKWRSSVNMKVFQCSAVQLLCFLANSYLFIFNLSVNSCFLTGLMAFLPPMIRRFFTALALVSVLVKSNPLCKSKLFFWGAQLALPHYESIISRGCFALPYAFSFPLWCCWSSFFSLFYQMRGSGLVYI